MTTLEKPRCPDAHRSWYSKTDICELNTKVCLLEAGYDCQTYNEYLAEEVKRVLTEE